MTIGKPAPRFLPTLTEVVHPVAPSTQEATSSDVLVERLLQRVVPSVEAHLRELLKTIVQEQMELLAPRVKQEVETAVRAAVAKEMQRPDSMHT